MSEQSLPTYAQTFRAHGLCFVSGQVPVDSDGRSLPADDLEGQVNQVFANLEACLADEGLGLPDIVSMTTYLRDIADAPRVSQIRGRFLGEHRTSSTVVEVSRLIGPSWRLEIQAVAMTRNADGR